MSQCFVTVSAFIPYEGRALVLQRASHRKFLPGHWEQAGGKVEAGEHPYDAAVRETQEETGITIRVVRPYYINHYTMTDGRDMVEIALVCLSAGAPKVRLSNAHQEFRWVDVKTLQNLTPLSDGMRGVILEGFRFLGES